MMDVHSFLALYGKPKEHTYEFECAELWLNENVLPNMIKAAQCGESSFEFVVETTQADVGVICGVLEEKGYATLWWPVVSRPGHPTKQMKVEVSW
jgi:hypothetical protein